MENKEVIIKGNRNNTNNETFLIGREEYIKKIYLEFDKVLEGGMGINFIEGKSGIGKTYLVEKSKNLFLRNNGTYIRIKFKKENRDEYYFIKEFLDRVIKKILMLPKNEYKIAKKIFKEAVGGDTELITDLSEDGDKIFGKSGQYETRKIEGKRVLKISLEVIEAASKIFYPLVVFVDDLQWSDELSLEIIRNYINKNQILNFHLISAYRSEFEIKTTQIPIDLVRKNLIKLNEFNENETKNYVKEIIRGADEEKKLSKIIYNFTGGNPLHIRVFAYELQDKKIIIEDKKNNKVKLDFEKIRKLKMPKKFENIIKDNLEILKESEEQIIQIISCFGGSIEYDILKVIVDTENSKLYEDIIKLVEKSFLIVENDSVNIAHDRINEIVFKELEKEQKHLIYYDMAEKLRKNLNDNSSKSELIRIANFATKTEIKYLENNNLAWIDFLFNVGKIANRSELFNTSKKIYELGQELINNCGENIDRNFNLDFQLDYMEYQFVSGETKKAEKRYLEILKEYKQKNMKIKIQLKYINFYSYSAQWDKVLELGQIILKDLNFNISTKSTVKDLLVSRIYFRKKGINHLKKSTEITGERIIHILEVLTIMFPAANRIDLDMFTTISLKLAIISKKYGKSVYSTVGYSAYCYILFFVFKDYKNGNLLQNTILDLMNKNPYKYKKSIPYALIGTFTYHWTNSFKDTIECLSKSVKEGKREGEYLFSNYAIVFIIITKYVMGENIFEIEKYIKYSMTKKERLENYLTREIYNIYILHLDILKNGESDREYSADKNKIHFHDTLILNWNMLKIHRLYLESKNKEAYELMEKIENNVWKHKGFVLNGLFLFFSTLIRIKENSYLSIKKQKKNINIIKNNIKRMKEFGELNKGNHFPRYLLAKAEYKRLIENSKDIDTLYHKSIEISSGENNLHMEAISNMLAAEYYSKNKKLSEFYLQEAAKLFEEWGADYISNTINPQKKVSKKDFIKNNYNENLGNENEVEIIEIMKGVNKSSNEAHVSVLNYLHKKFNYKYACFLYEKNGVFNLKYEKKSETPPVIIEKTVNINFIENIPVKLIRYAARTEKVVISEGSEEIKVNVDGKSVDKSNEETHICIPLKHKNVLLGIFYIKLEEDQDKYEDILYICRWILNEISKKNFNIENKKKNRPKSNLTKRETEIITLIGKGLSNNEISEKLFISVGTVRNHLSKAYSKLDVDNRVQAIIESKDRGII